jgi:hypothetical protein
MKNLLASLSFVAGAAAKDKNASTLTHYRILNGRITGSNGSLSLSSPIALDLDVSPKAVVFTRAVKSCSGVVKMHLTKGGKLSVASDGFKVVVDCTADVFPDITLDGEYTALTGGLLPALKVLLPFVAVESPRPWALGVLFDGAFAFATNNYVIARKELPVAFPVKINVPREAVSEMLRIGEEPIGMRTTESAVVFYYEGDRWLKTQLYACGWPDLTRMLTFPTPSEALPVTFFDAVDKLVPFMARSGCIILEDDKVRTHDTGDASGAETSHASFAFPRSSFAYKNLILLRDVATAIDLTAYPKACPFIGVGLVGIVAGMLL